MSSLDFSRSIVASKAPRTAAPRPEIDSRDLLRGSRELLIKHGDQEYRLRQTQNDKLILTK